MLLDEERVGLVQLRRVRKVFYDHQRLVEPLLAGVGNLALRRLVPRVLIGLLALRVHPQVLLDVLLDEDPAVVDVDADPFEDRLISAAVLPLGSVHCSRFHRSLPY